MSYSFNLSRNVTKGLFYFSLIMTLSGAVTFLLSDMLVLEVWGAAAFLTGLPLISITIWKFRLQNPVLFIDSHGVFDRQSMSEAVPWSAIRGISAKIYRKENLFSDSVSVDEIEIRVASIEPFTRNLKALGPWWRGNARRSQQGDAFSILPGQFREDAETLLSAFKALGPPSASRAYIKYLHALRMPAVTAGEISNELKKVVLDELDLQEALAFIGSALQGPLSPAANEIVDRIAAHCVRLDEPAIREMLVRDLTSLDGQRCLVASRLNNALVDAGYTFVASDTDEDMLDQYVQRRDSIRPFSGRVFSKVIHYGFLLAAGFGMYWVLRLGLGWAKGNFGW